MNKTGSLADLHNRLFDCRLCLKSGYEIYPHAVVSGVADAKIMTIGQAPGITEQKANRPFNAGSGTRLFKWLGKAGINEDWFRSTQYMTSVTKCYPGRSRSGGGDRVPTRVEQKLCRPYLEEEFMLVDPSLVIPIGRLAIELYYPKKLALNEIIGSQREIDGRKIVPLPHPSGASRWHQIPEHQELLEKAVDIIHIHAKQLYPNIIN